MDGESMKAIIDTAQLAVEVGVIDITEPTIRAEPIRITAVPTGDGGVKLQSLKTFLDEWRTAPERRTGTAKLHTLDALSVFIDRHKDADSVIFAEIDAATPAITAVFDYHTIDHAPRYGKHRAVYAFPLSPEWKAWKGKNGVFFTQTDWAFWIEDHIAELAAPHADESHKYEALFGTKIGTPAELIGLSRGLAITVESKIRDFRTLQSGEVEVSYEEVHKDGRGEKLIVPGLFLLSIPLFVDAEPTRILARLRYRKGVPLTWHYQLYRADEEAREAMRSSARTLADAAALPLYEGSPEA